MRITKSQLRRIIREAMGSDMMVTYVFPSAIDFQKARQVLDDAMLSAEFGRDEVMVKSFDEEDVDFAFQDARVRYRKQ